MNMSANRRKILTAGALIAAGCAGAFAQQGYPGKPIRLIVPYPPGGGTTIVAHLLSTRLNESWGQSLIVDNRGGGGGIIGTTAMLQAPADGYTLLLASSTHVTNPLLLAVPYDAIRDFTAVTSLYSSELVLVANPALPVNTLQEFIALAKSQPGKLNYGVVSLGGTTHLAGELLNVLAGTKTQHVAYKGAGPAMQDLIGGQVQFSFVAPAAALPFLKNGQLKAIAISGEKRLPAMPQVPTFAEAGLAEFQSRIWFGILARAGTPKEIVDKLAAEIGRIMALPEMKEKLVSQGLEAFVAGPEQFSAVLKSDMAKYANLVKAANIKLEQ
ncbi:MAG TPA: tripartite tricarboxylate transporter substrate binding protein [Ramlibacter sp.]|nr:tripartite tricarboxylate transporter substrate binding protein [Ramlibacter sp.]